MFEAKTQKKKNPRPRTEMLEAKAKDSFSKLSLKQFPLSLNVQVSRILYFIKFSMANFPRGFRRSPTKKKRS